MQKQTVVFVRVCQQFRCGIGLALAIALVTVLGPTAAARAATVTATVDRSTIALGESVTLSLSIQGANTSQPTLPAIPNFRLVGTRSSFSFNSAVGVAQQTFTYQLVPSQAGDFVIPAFQFAAGSETVTTQPIQIKVLPPGSAVTPPGAAVPTAFVRVLTPKTQLYVGELSEVEVQVYFRDGQLREYPRLPADSGFTVGQWLKPVQTRANVSNQLFNLVIFKQPITPVKAGALSLGPAGVSIFRGGDFFTRPTEVRLPSDRAAVQVLPIPDQNMPPTFAGAVGNFSLSVTAAPTNIAAGDPITVRAQIRGRGSLDAVKLPPQPDWNEFKTYPPTSKIENADPNNTAGTKSFEQVVVPERAGIAALPPLVFSFFDPDQRTFRTLTGPAIPLTVRPSSGGSSALPSLPGGTNAAPAPPGSDLAHIKPYLGTAAPGSIILARPAFWLAQLIPPAVWLGVLLWRRRREHLANNPRLRRQQEVSQKVRQGLVELQAQAAERNSDAFFATVLRLLQEQVGERLDLPATAITEAVVDERLRRAGASDSLCTTLKELFHLCNLARYAPVKSSQELSAVIPKLEAALAELRGWQPAKP